MSKTLVLITGTGRSGTSTMSGTFHHLGLHVPGPYLGANESNPKGFFESKWAVKFHKQITVAAGINDFDSRPAAFDLAQAAITDAMRSELTEFLARESADHDQVVVKDPRSVWAQGLWRAAAADAGLEIRYISMLRHPAEVVGSRTTYYANPNDEAKRRSYETFNVARWINSSLVSEQQTRGQVRAFVSYPDLLVDWRPVLTGLATDLGLTYDVDVAAGEATPVDDFIDPGLRRHQVTWDELDVPAELQDIAERTWDDVVTLAAAHGVDEAASADIDVQSERYARLFAASADIAHDALETERTDAKRKAAAQPAKAAEPKKQKPRPPSRPRPPRSVAEMPVGEVGGKDLLKVIAARAKGKLRR